MADLVRIVYTPEGGSQREWTFDMENPPWDVMKYACKAAGSGWASLMSRLADVDPEAFQALVWVLRKRDEPRLEFDSVGFPSGLLNEVKVEDANPVVEPEGEGDPKATT